MSLLSKNIAALALSCLSLLGCGGESKDSLASLYSVGGLISGLGAEKTVTLENNNQNNEVIISANGKFTFPERLFLTASYNVSVKTQPQGQRCSVAQGSGNLVNGSVSNIRVICLNSGRLDPKLDTDGIVVHDSAAGGTADDEGQFLALGADGKILVTGYSLNASGNRDMTIWRYNPDGSLDTGFDADGIVTHHGAAGGDGDDEGQSIILDAVGNILVTGYSVNAFVSPAVSGNRDMVIWRYTPNGTLDTSFDTNGIVVHDNAAGGSGVDVGLSMAQDATNKIVVTGYSQNISNNRDMVIWRYNSNGSPDTSFNAVGIVMHHGAAGGNNDDEGISLALDAEGKILVAGYSLNVSSKQDMVIWRYNLDGSLDSIFDTDGIVVHDSAAGGNGDDEGRSLTLDFDGKILVTGNSLNVSSNKDMVIWRYNPDGTPDSNFDTDGIVVHHNAAGGNGDDEGRSLLLDFNGKIMVTGYSHNALNNKDMVIWRYNP